MSYEIRQLIGLGIKVRDIAANMIGESLQIFDDGPSHLAMEENACYVQINESLIKSYENFLSDNLITKEGEFPDSNMFKNIEISEYMAPSSAPGNCLVLTIFSLCGVKTEFLNKGEHIADTDNIFSEFSLFPYGEMFAQSEGASATCQGGYIYLKSTNNMVNNLFIRTLNEKGLITSFNQEFDDDDEDVPLFNINMEKSLDNILNAQAATKGSYDNSPQLLAHFLLKQYLESKEINVETDVCSTRCGDVHEYGGMEDDELYLTFDVLTGVEDWDDPCKDEESAVELKEIEKILVGPDHIGFEILKPIFGG